MSRSEGEKYRAATESVTLFIGIGLHAMLDTVEQAPGAARTAMGHQFAVCPQTPW
jgi:hypothetical protein